MKKSAVPRTTATQLAVVATATLVAVSACGSGGSGGSGGAKAAGGSFVINTNAESVGILDPVRNPDVCDVNPLANVYDQLVRKTQAGQLTPGLAASWSAPDPTTFVMHLQPGVKFQDGTPFNAAAVADAIKREQTDPLSTVKASVKAIASVTTPNSTTVELHLSAPIAGEMPGIFTGLAGLIPSPTAVQKAGNNYGVTTAVGAGPYQVSSFTADNNLALRSWKGYWDPAQQTFGGVNFPNQQTYTTNQALAIPAVQQGSLQLADIRDTNVSQVKGSSSIHVAQAPSTQYLEFYVNFGVAPWNNINVRKALEYALNRDAIAKSVSSADIAAWQPLPPTQGGHNNSVDNMYPYNPAKAKQLLAQAGYPNGLHVPVMEIENAYYQHVAEAAQAMLAQSGIDITLEPVPGTAVVKDLYVAKTYNAAITAYQGNPDPGTTLNTLFSSAGAFNVSGVSTPGLDAVLQQAAATTDTSKQAAMYQQASQIIMQNALAIPLFFESAVTIYTSKVAGVTTGQTNCNSGNFTESPAIHPAK